jgi:hypothetical protein
VDTTIAPRNLTQEFFARLLEKRWLELGHVGPGLRSVAPFRTTNTENQTQTQAREIPSGNDEFKRRPE